MKVPASAAASSSTRAQGEERAALAFVGQVRSMNGVVSSMETPTMTPAIVPPATGRLSYHGNLLTAVLLGGGPLPASREMEPRWNPESCAAAEIRVNWGG